MSEISQLGYDKIPRERLSTQANYHYVNSNYEQARLIYTALLEGHGLTTTEWLQLAECFKGLSKFHAALGCYHQALDSGLVEDADFLTKMVNIHKELGNYDIALNYALKSIEKSCDLTICMNYVTLLTEMKRFNDALKILADMTKKFPDNKQVIREINYVKLHLPKDKNAWRDADMRYNDNNIKSPLIKIHTPIWQGECLKGKKLYLTKASRFSDNILMIRFLRNLNDMGAIITLECKIELKSLFQNLPVEKLAIPYDYSDTEYDFYCPLMALPALLGISDDTIPNPHTLLPPTLARIVVDEKMKIPNDEKLNIGIAWSGDHTFSDNRNRSINVKDFLTLSTRVCNCRFISLQKGPQVFELKKNENTNLIQDYSENVTDFSVTAAIMTKMDIIVTVDCAVAHLAGCLGLPVLTLLPYKPYWLYFPESVTSSWYPSYRLLRQTEPNNWRPVFDKIEKVVSSLSRTKMELGVLTKSVIFESIDTTIQE